jgi:hypothetical protein
MRARTRGIHPFERWKTGINYAHGGRASGAAHCAASRIMRMQVSEQGDEVFIELSGVAGRHQRILQALTSGPIAHGPDVPGLNAADVSVRAGADEMHIRLKGRAGHHFEALSIYHHLRHALVEREDAADPDAGTDLRTRAAAASAC